MGVTTIQVSSLAMKMAANVLAILAPLAILSPAEYGRYSLALSIVWILAAVFDGGVGLQASVSGHNRETVLGLIEFANNRDAVILAFIALAVICSADVLTCSMALAAMLTGRWTSLSGVLRGTGRSLPDLFISTSSALFTVLLAFALAASKDAALASPSMLLLLLVCAPRAIALCLGFNTAPCHRRSETSRTSPIYPSIAFATSALLTVASANLDIVVVGALVPGEQLAVFRISTLLLGLGLVLPDLLAQSVQTQSSAAKSEFRGVQHSMAARLSAFGNSYYLTFLAVASAVLSMALDMEFMHAVISMTPIAAALALKVHSFRFAASLTAIGAQQARVGVAILVLTVYLVLIFAFSFFTKTWSLPLALAISSALQYVCYRVIAGRVAAEGCASHD